VNEIDLLPINVADKWKLKILNYLSGVREASIDEINRKHNTRQNKAIKNAITFLELGQYVSVRRDPHVRRVYRICAITESGISFLKSFGISPKSVALSEDQEANKVFIENLENSWRAVIDVLNDAVHANSQFKEIQMTIRKKWSDFKNANRPVVKKNIIKSMLEFERFQEPTSTIIFIKSDRIINSF